MRLEIKVNPNEKWEVLKWFEKNCPDSKHPLTRVDILPCILLDMPFSTPQEKEAKDRHFRRIASELIHEGHLCSSTKGYWFCKLWTNDREEIRAIKNSLFERKAKALSMLADVDGQIKQVEGIEAKITQGQRELALPV